jgi:hypothetical protein
MNDLPVRLAQQKVMTDLLAILKNNEEKIRSMPLVEEANYDNLLFLMENGVDRNLQVPVDKTGRWIGFVQCALIIRRILDTKTERDQTRALFHAAYLATGQEIPPTINR